MISIHINNKPIDIHEELTLQNLISSLKIQKKGTAVAINDRVIPRSQHHLITIKDGDRLDVIRAVGGG